jgi:hypothetical protein
MTHNRYQNAFGEIEMLSLGSSFLDFTPQLPRIINFDAIRNLHMPR